MDDRMLVQAPKTFFPRWLLVWVFFVTCTCRFLLGAALAGVDAREWLLYQASTLGFNYFDFGAVRRGLAGSAVYLLSPDLRIGTVIFHVLCGVGVSSIVVLLLRRADLGRCQRLAFAATFALIALRWGDDGGRTDMAVATCLAGATLAVTKGRAVLAVLLVGIGLFVHETSLIFGGPLLLALWWQRGGAGALTRGQRAGVLALFAAALAGYALLNRLPHADVPTMVEGVRSKLPLYKHVDWAIYYAVSGLRGVQTSICQNIHDPNNWLHPTSGLIVLWLTWVALGSRMLSLLRWVALAALPGFVFLCTVANDDSRWTMFACFNIWLVMLAAPRIPAQTRALSKGALLALVVLAPLVVYRPSVVEYRIYAPSPFLEGVARRLGGPRTPSVEEALLRCDPEWREVLDGKRD